MNVNDMLKNLWLILVLVCIAAIWGFGQKAVAEKWTLIEMEKKEISAAFPPDYVVDAKKRPSGQIYRILGFRNGVSMDMKIYKDNDARNRINRVFANGSGDSYVFKAGNIQGKRLMSAAGNDGYFEKVYLASGDRFYYLTVEALLAQKDEAIRFLGSIRINGKTLYTRPASVDWPEEIVSITSLDTSPLVTQALDRKYEKHEVKISYEPESIFTPLPDITTNGIKPAIVIERPNPEFQPSPGFGSSHSRMSAKLVIKYLANGQIGDIVVYSNSSKGFMRGCAEAAKKIKFIPARDGDKNVDFVGLQEYDVVEGLVKTEVVLVPGIRPF